jgi:hypothetical protein
MAKEALARWRRDGVQLGEHSADHVDAYMVVKQRTTAIRVRPAAVLQVLASTVDVSECFAQLSTELIVTRRSKFPNGVPKAMIQFLVTADEIALNYKQVNDLDLEDVYIVDWSAPPIRTRHEGFNCFVREEGWHNQEAQGLHRLR